jgi:hypothetical protein
MLNFICNIFYSYKLVLTEDGKFGAQNADGTWNGMIGMVSGQVCVQT